jgi:hypothetical protein
MTAHPDKIARAPAGPAGTLSPPQIEDCEFWASTKCSPRSDWALALNRRIGELHDQINGAVLRGEDNAISKAMHRRFGVQDLLEENRRLKDELDTYGMVLANEQLFMCADDSDQNRMRTMFVRVRE